VLDGSFPVVAPTVIVTWVTVANDTSSAPVVVIYVEHVDANATYFPDGNDGELHVGALFMLYRTAPNTTVLRQVLLNGIDITSGVPLPALGLSSRSRRCLGCTTQFVAP